jgi:hypothetical protein
VCREEHRRRTNQVKRVSDEQGNPHAPGRGPGDHRRPGIRRRAYAVSEPYTAPDGSPSLTAAGEGSQAPASAQEQAAVQAAVQDGGGNIPAIAGVLLTGALTAYLVARRKNQTCSTDGVV